MEFVPFGAADKIKLTIAIVQTIIAVPTKSGRTCSERDAMKFMMLCQAQRLNPFAGDAFLIGYDGQNGPTFSLITAHQAFLKRAETCKDYDGMESGIIIQDKDDSIKEIEGDFHLPDQVVLGGWAKVYHKGRTKTTYRRIRMERFNNGFAQWKVDAPGMICKCAEADALRSTFPTLLGGLYVEGEQMTIVDVTSQPAPPSGSPLVQIAAPAPDTESRPDETSPEPPSPAPTRSADSPQALLASFVTGEGFTFADLCAWGEGTGNIPDASSLPSFEDIPTAIAKRILNAKTGLLKALKEAKGRNE